MKVAVCAAIAASLLSIQTLGSAPANAQPIDWNDADTRFYVVINHEEQYSIWPVGRHTPKAWRFASGPRKKSDCLEYIEEVWTDMRPKGLGQDRTRYFGWLELQLPQTPQPRPSPPPVVARAADSNSAFIASDRDWQKRVTHLSVIVINDEGQFSVLPANMTVPPGWDRVGGTCARRDCLEIVETIWTNWLPLSLQLNHDVVARQQRTGLDRAEQLAIGQVWYKNSQDVADWEFGKGNSHHVIVSAAGQVSVMARGILPVGDWRSTGFICSQAECDKVILTAILEDS